MVTYRKFDILEVAETCGITINTSTLERSEVEAWCPFCSTASTDYHMYINREKERFYCQKCSASGNSVSLYARIFGVSNKEAAHRLSDGCHDGVPKTAMPSKPFGYDAAPLRRRHDVYYDMLVEMDLSEAHLRNLRNRGLSGDRIVRNMYRSMPADFQRRRQIASSLAKRHDLRGIPGFYYSKDGWELWGKPGILIPICDADGYIQGLQVRLDNANKKKYRWLSSNPDYGLPYGTASSTWVHVTGRRPEACQPVVECELTEGALKGDVSSYLAGDRLYVCIAGVSSTKHLYPTLKALHVSKVNGCFDMDQVETLGILEVLRMNPGLVEKMIQQQSIQDGSGIYCDPAVAEMILRLRNLGMDLRYVDIHKRCPLERMEAMVKTAGMEYERWVWPMVHNGIDEYYLAQLKKRIAA